MSRLRLFDGQRRWFCHLGLTLCLTLLTTVALQSRLLSEEPKSDDAKWADDALRWGGWEAAAYQISVHEHPELTAKLIEKPVLRWSNSVVSTVHGNVFLWTREGRPVAVASIYKFFTNKDEFAAEFHSLTTERIVARKRDQQVWQPQAAGVRLVDIPEAPAPADSPTQRLRQMRALAAQFQAHMLRWSDKEKSDLRLLTTPIYRYAVKDAQTTDDGAIFAFVTATDPEVLLLLQVGQTNGKSVWQYGLARMNIGELWVEHRDREVWRVDQLPYPFRKPNEPYCLFDSLPLPSEPGK